MSDSFLHGSYEELFLTEAQESEWCIDCLVVRASVITREGAFCASCAARARSFSDIEVMRE